MSSTASLSRPRSPTDLEAGPREESHLPRRTDAQKRAHDWWEDTKRLFPADHAAQLLKRKGPDFFERGLPELPSFFGGGASSSSQPEPSVPAVHPDATSATALANQGEHPLASESAAGRLELPKWDRPTLVEGPLPIHNAGYRVAVNLAAPGDYADRRNVLKYRAISIGFGLVLAGGAFALTGVAVGAGPDLARRKAKQGETILKFSLTVVGAVIAGLGAGLAFLKAFGDDDGGEGWIKTWTPPKRGLAAASTFAASKLGFSISTRERTRRKAEVAALMWAWSELISSSESVESVELKERANHIISFELDARRGGQREKLQEALAGSLKSSVEPARIDRLNAVTFHAVRLLWQQKGWAGTLPHVPSAAQSLERLRGLGFVALPSVQALVTDRLKTLDVAVDEPEESVRAAGRQLYAQCGGDSRRDPSIQ